MQYDIFISYRRDGGEALACLLCERLKRRGFSVFYDVESLRNGLFNEKIYEVIEQCKDVIAVLPENGLDRCIDKEDWVRKELSRAIILEKNIIPVLMRNFFFPPILPDDLKKLPNYNGVSANLEYFDATFDKLIGMLSSATNRKFVNMKTNLLYYTFSQYIDRKRVLCKIEIDEFSHVVMYANVKNDNINQYEYKYIGEAVETEHNVYLRLDNCKSTEKVHIILAKSAGGFDRYLGILNALSTAMLPVSFKCVCLSDDDLGRLNEEVLNRILSHSNVEWNGNVLAIESFQMNLFYSDALFHD